MARNGTARILHDVGLAAWFGGSLMGAIGLNGAANEVKDPADRARVSSLGWARWSPANAVAIGLHLAGGTILVRANRGRVANQQGVAGWTGAKLGVTAAALAASVASGLLGRTLQREGSVPAEGAVVPSPSTPAAAAKTQQRLRLLQWVVPALTGGIVVIAAVMGEQQRPGEVVKGLLKT